MSYDFSLDMESRNSLSLLIKRIKPHSTVLEFGTAHGRMTKHLKEELGCKVYGVEIDTNAASHARLYAEEILVDDIESYAWMRAFEQIKFDAIVFADVLEHLKHPDVLLETIKPFLKEDGSVLISLPNIAHNAIVINLLKNQFDYSANGILDETHIKFFTQKSFNALIEASGYHTQYESAVYISPKNTEFSNGYDELPEEFGAYLSGLPWGEMYQFVYELKTYPVEKISDFCEAYKVSGTSFIQLFSDTGEGFSEQESQRIAFHHQHVVHFDLANCMPIKRLRFDPLDSYAVVKIECVKKEGHCFDCTLTSNAFFMQNGIYYFDVKDPQVYINFEEVQTFGVISFELEYLFIGEEASLHIERVYKKLFKEDRALLGTQQEHIENLKKSLGNKSLQLQHYRDEIVRLQQLAQSMRIKNRVKRLLPKSLVRALKALVFHIAFYKKQYLKFRALSDANGFLFTVNQLYKSTLYKHQALSFNTTTLEEEIVSPIQEKVSVIIPTFNGLSDLVRLIPQLLRQKGFLSLEIVIVDSSSSDGTSAFIEMFPDIKFISIAQKDFSHAYARNLGFEACSGAYVLFLVQDALPQSDMWLYRFYTLLEHYNLAALSCKQLPNAQADLFTCYGLENFNTFLGLAQKRTKITEKYIAGTTFSRELAQLDNVACLFRADIFAQYLFRGRYAEDLDIGLRMIQDNQRIGITSEVCVIHSHLRSAYYYLKRALVETVVLDVMFERNVNKTLLVDTELGDIYSAFYGIGALLVRMQENDFSCVSVEYFKHFVLEQWSEVMTKESFENNFDVIYGCLSSYDKALADIMKLLRDHHVTINRGALHDAIDHFLKEGLAYVEKRYTDIDEKLFLEFRYFILKTFASNVGVKLGALAPLVEHSEHFIAPLMITLQEGV